MRNAAGNPQGIGAFKTVKVGGGGFVTGISISNNGATKVIRTDVSNGYVKGAADKVWRPLFTPASLAVGEYPNSAGYPGASGLAGNSPFGCYEAVVAPSDPTRIYATANARLYRSEDTGATFTKCTGLAATKMYSNNGGDRLFGKKIAVDNQNPDVLLLGTMSDGLYYSTNKGVTMTQVVIGANTGGNPDPHLVAVDPISTVTSTIRQRWFAVRQGTGVYVSTTGPGGTYTLMTGSPTSASDMKFDASGNCYVVAQTGTKNLWRCAAGGTTWVQNATMPATACLTVAINPLNVNQIVLLTTDSYAAVSVDGGSTWLSGANWFENSPFTGSINQYALSVPWLKFGKAVKHFPAHAMFDPVTSGKLWSAEGLGVRNCTAPTTANNDATGRFDWIEETEGIYELVATHIMTPPGGAAILNFWDKPIWRVSDPSVFTREGPFCPGSNSLAVEAGWDSAYAADNPLWMAALVNQGGGFHGYSTDGGSTWQQFPNQPPNNGNGGCIVVGNAGQVMIFYSNNGQPVRTKDGGATAWTTVPFPNLPANTVENGWGFNYVISRHIVTYDAIAKETYAYNYGRVAATGEAGVWKSTDWGDTWTHVFIGHLNDGGNNDGWWAKLRAVPGNTGHLFFTVGKDFPTDTFKRSTDGGVTWTAVPNVTGVTDFGFGKIAPGKTYPSICLYGSVSAVLGAWRSDDNCVSWVKLSNAWPNNNIDEVRVCSGDLNQYGRCWVGFAGSGFAYCDYDDKVTLA